MQKNPKKELDRHTLRDRGAFLNHFSLKELKRTPPHKKES